MDKREDEDREEVFFRLWELVSKPKSRNGILYRFELKQKHMSEALVLAILEHMEQYPWNNLPLPHEIEEICISARSIRRTMQREENRYNERHESIEQVNGDNVPYSLIDIKGLAAESAEETMIRQMRFQRCLDAMPPQYKEHIEQLCKIGKYQDVDTETFKPDKNLAHRAKKKFLQEWHG